jgi:hypothetical protein
MVGSVCVVSILPNVLPSATFVTGKTKTYDRNILFFIIPDNTFLIGTAFVDQSV